MENAKIEKLKCDIYSDFQKLFSVQNCTSRIVVLNSSSIPYQMFASSLRRRMQFDSAWVSDTTMFDSSEKYKSEFENVRKIGSGKFGTVYQVRNVHSGDVFAAKVVK